MSELNVEAVKDLVEGSGLSYRKNSVSWIFTCPRCNKKDKAYMLQRGRCTFVCWYCESISGYKGRPEYLLSDLLGLPLSEVRRTLYGVVAQWSPDPLIPMPIWADYADENEELYLEESKEVFFPIDFHEIDQPAAKKGRAYLEGRGIPLDIATQYGIRYWPQEQRVVFPLIVNGILEGWQSRLVIKDKWIDIDGKEYQKPKALTSAGADRENSVLFQDRLIGSSHAVVAEGPISAIKAHLVGGNVATLGKSISEGQISVLRKAGIKRVYWAIDPDARDALTRLCRETTGDFENFYLPPLNDNSDLGDMTFEQVLYQVENNAERIHAGKIFVPPFKGRPCHIATPSIE